tara:strand:+ start:1522 stop:2967 length:1446 start_codon:yes stop_codon:yes gene_type:complete
MKDRILYSKKFVLILFMIPALFLLYLNLFKNSYGCFNGYDLGIYGQAILKLSSFSDLNPFVSIRGIEIFNDHFDPVIFIPAILLNLFGGGVNLLIIFEWFMFLSFLPLLLKMTNSSKQFLYLGALYFLSVGVVGALLYPIHASYWSIPIWALLAKSIVKNELKSVLLYSILLCFFKESYPFAILGLSIGFGLIRNLRYCLSVGVVALAFLFFIFVLRPIIFGPVYGHGEELVRNLLNNHVQFILSLVLDLNYKDFVKNWLPPFIIGLIGILNNATRRNAILLLFLTLPILGIQFLANKFAHQYSFMWSVVWITFFALSYKELDVGAKRKSLILIAFLIGGVKFYELGFRFLAFNKSNKCSISQARERDISEARRLTKSYSKRILATGGMSVALLDKEINIYQFCSHGDIEPEYEMLVLEKNRFGEIYPLNHKTLEDLLTKCKNFGKVKYESQGLLILEGEFSNSRCLGYREGECSQYINQN